tara:strand:+ start:498 stop:1016 length:519 start_codon:yes stop_codon:yes gene_type:complete
MMPQKLNKLLSALILLFGLTACSGGYSFTGGDVGDAKTVRIDFFPNNAELIKPQLSQIFTETLRDIFVQQTPLELVNKGGDMLFEGSIIRYSIDPINAQASDIGAVAQNRLTVEVNVLFTNTKDEKASFEKKFSRFVDFDSNTDINQIESDLHDQVCQELSENILNSAIGNW